MGMYTELVLKCMVKQDRPEIVHKVLSYMFPQDLDRPDELPEHEFFKTERWYLIGGSSSCYHIPSPSAYYDGRYLFSRSDLKNYGNEISLFLDWLNPYLDNYPGECIGWVWYEEDHEPQLIYAKMKDSE